MKNLLKGINEDKGLMVSDLEAMLIVMYKLISDKLEEKPKAGITLAKGKKNEKKVRYKGVKEDLLALIDFCSAKGMLSIGVCETCKSYSTSGHASKNFGTCKKTGKQCHRWDTCKEHSKKGGGYGAQ